MIGNLSLDTTIQVGTSDAGSYFNTLVLEAVDYGVVSLAMSQWKNQLDLCVYLDGQCPPVVRQCQCR